MKLFKKLTIILLAVGLSGLLISLAFGAAFITSVANSTELKRNLAESGIYQDLTDKALQEAQEELRSAVPSAAAPYTQEAAREAFTTQITQQASEKFIDGLYRWLEGQVTVPDFKIDLTEPKQMLADKLAAKVLSRLQNLPACTLTELQSLNPQSVDPVSLTCQPPNIDYPAQAENIRQQLLSSPQFLPDPVITAEDIPKNANGQTVFEQNQQIPVTYQSLKSSFWPTVTAAVLVAVVIVLLYPNRRQGVRFLGIILLIMTVLVLFMLFIYSAAIDAPTLAKDVEQPLQQSVIKFLGALLSSVQESILQFAALYAAIGASLLLGAIFWKPAAKKKHVKHHK